MKVLTPIFALVLVAAILAAWISRRRAQARNQVWPPKVLAKAMANKEAREQAVKALNLAREVLAGNENDLVILDEINCALDFGLITVNDVTAMAASKPVVATSVGGVAEMLGENSDRGLLINVGDIDGLAKASLRILQNPSLAVRMGQAGKFFARENYHTDIIAQRTFEIYANMLRKRMEI